MIRQLLCYGLGNRVGFLITEGYEPVTLIGGAGVLLIAATVTSQKWKADRTGGVKALGEAVAAKRWMEGKTGCTSVIRGIV